jgi:Leucine-rich repeat (LRR) protein
MERKRTDSSSSDSSSDGTAITGVPIAMRRQTSRERNLPCTSKATSSRSDATSKQEERIPSKSVSLDFSYLDLELSAVEANLAVHVIRPELITTLNLSGNRLEKVPMIIDLFYNLQILDVSQNYLSGLPEGLNNLKNLATLIGSNNRLNVESFSKDFGISMSGSLKVLSLGGNELTCIPTQVLEMSQLRSLYLGSNRITELTKDICRLENLRVLYLGGNQLTSIPQEVGLLQNLQALSLCENKLQSLPPSIARLRNLKSLGLHKNLLTALPPEIVKLRGLHELSLRGNPLVCRFVKDFTFECPSLLELAGRAVKTAKIPYNQYALPFNLVEYLETARRCVNSKCKGNV